MIGGGGASGLVGGRGRLQEQRGRRGHGHVPVVAELLLLVAALLVLGRRALRVVVHDVLGGVVGRRALRLGVHGRAELEVLELGGNWTTMRNVV